MQETYIDGRGMFLKTFGWSEKRNTSWDQSFAAQFQNCHHWWIMAFNCQVFCDKWLRGQCLLVPSSMLLPNLSLLLSYYTAALGKFLSIWLSHSWTPATRLPVLSKWLPKGKVFMEAKIWYSEGNIPEDKTKGMSSRLLEQGVCLFYYGTNFVMLDNSSAISLVLFFISYAETRNYFIGLST
jgi:hypothetical protein